MGKLTFVDTALAELREKGLYNVIRTIESSAGAWVTIEGRRVLNLCSNNYLGLADDQRLREAATAIAFPTVPHGKARTRVTMFAGHSADDLEFAVDAFAHVGRELEVIRR